MPKKTFETLNRKQANDRSFIGASPSRPLVIVHKKKPT